MASLTAPGVTVGIGIADDVRVVVRIVLGTLRLLVVFARRACGTQLSWTHVLIRSSLCDGNMEL